MAINIRKTLFKGFVKLSKTFQNMNIGKDSVFTQKEHYQIWGKNFFLSQWNFVVALSLVSLPEATGGAITMFQSLSPESSIS